MSILRYANQFVCDLVAYEPGKPIEETARELGLKPEQIIKLASNENPLGPSPKAKEAMREAMANAKPLFHKREVIHRPDGISISR